MRKFMMALFLLTSIMLFSVASVAAQTAPDRIDISVGLTCGSIDVTIDSDYERAIKAQVYAGTRGLTEWNLVNDIGDFTIANPYGAGSRTYFFIIQDPNTPISFSIRVYDDVSNALVDIFEGTRDCDGEANNAAPTTTTTTTTTATTTQTATFLASCDVTGGITVQPIGGVPFSISSTQIGQGTAMAIANNQNIAITNTGGIAVFGTPANAVQMIAGDGYTLTIPALSCSQTVTVPTTTTTTYSASAQAANLSCDNVPADAVNTHVVNRGENLFRIGLRYGVPFPRLAAYNGIPDATRIFVGQCIGIPPSA